MKFVLFFSSFFVTLFCHSNVTFGTFLDDGGILSHDVKEPRFFKLPDSKTSACTTLGYTFLPSSGDCVQFIRALQGYNSAREMCHGLGGEIWVANITDPFFIMNLAKEYPGVFSVTDLKLWIGVTTEEGRLIDLNGNDVTSTYHGVLSDISSADAVADGGCVFVDFTGGCCPQLKAGECNGEEVTAYYMCTKYVGPSSGVNKFGG